MRWPGSRSHLSLPARCTVSAPSISRNTNQGNTTLAQELCDFVGIVPLGTLLPYQLALQFSPLGVGGRMQAMLRGRRDKRKGPENPRANQQQVIKLLLIPLKPWGLPDLKSSCIYKRGVPHPLSPTTCHDRKLSPRDNAVFQNFKMLSYKRFLQSYTQYEHRKWQIMSCHVIKLSEWLKKKWGNLPFHK